MLCCDLKFYWKVYLHVAELIDDYIAISQQFDIEDHVPQRFTIDQNLRNIIR